MAAIPASDRLKLMLAVVPWIVANPGKTLAEIADRFGMEPDALSEELDVLWMIGLPPYTPDKLIEIIEDPETQGLTIRFAEYFARPLRLSHGEALTILAASEGLRSLPGGEADGPLDRALSKVRATLSPQATRAIDVDLGTPEAQVLDVLRRSAREGTEIEIRYYSANQDSVAQRKIAPWRVFAQNGAWYVVAWCSQAEGERIFRLDRIESVAELRTISPHRPDDTAIGADGAGLVFHPRPGDPTVTLKLKADHAWVLESFPVQHHQLHDDGSMTVTLVVTAVPWLERLLIQLGAGVEIVGEAGLGDVAQIRQAGARRVLGRYRE